MALPSLVEQIASEVIDFLDPEKCFGETFEFYHNKLSVQGKSLPLRGKVHLFGLGKAASFQLAAFKKLIEKAGYGESLAQCVSYTKRGHTVAGSWLIELEGDHPLVSKNNLEQSQQFIDHLKRVGAEDSVLFFLSGGGSALLERPKEGISFEEFIHKQKELLESGKTISEMNKERKALSEVKDGGLLNFIGTQTIYQFITSDIPSPRIEDVSSGPLLGSRGSIRENSFVLQSAPMLLDKLTSKNPQRIKGAVYDCSLAEGLSSLPLPEKGEFHFSGGEMPITLPHEGAGMGGRNTHFVLAYADFLYQRPENRDIKIMSLGTDGGDGPTDAAGAYIDFDLYRTLEPTSFLNDFNSYKYFEKLGTLIKTGPTRSNVMDLRVLWRE